MVSYSQLQKDIVSKLKIINNSDDVRDFEARLIIENVTGLNYSEMIINDHDIDINIDNNINSIISKRNTDKPLAYILGHSNFYGLEFNVDDRVLIPRSETEELVKKAIDILKNQEYQPQMVIDIGTGSGAIAVALACNVRNLEVLAIDISSDALELAQENYKSNTGKMYENSIIKFLKSDCFNNLDRSLLEKFDLIISNPPYIAKDEEDTIDDSVKQYEPHIALFAHDEGFAVYEKIIIESVNWLKPGGFLILEISPRHTKNIKDFINSCEYSELKIFEDLSKRDRICVAKMPG